MFRKRFFMFYQLANTAHEIFNRIAFWLETGALIDKIYKRAKGNSNTDNNNYPPF